MSTPRAGYGLPARPTEGRAQRLADAKLSGGIPRPVNRSLKPQGEPSPASSSQTQSQSSSVSRIPSRVPQPSSTRQLPRPQVVSKPMMPRQSTSWGSESTSASTNSNSQIQSGSSSSASSRSYETNSKPARNVLRRKKSLVSQNSTRPSLSPKISDIPPLVPRPRARADSAANNPLESQPSEAPASEVTSTSQGLTQSPVIYPELDRYRNYRKQEPSSIGSPVDVPYKLSTHDLPPPTPVSLPFSGSSSQLSASPSTKFSGSPGPGAYSRETTPTSISSHSPGISIPYPLFFKDRQLSPTQTRPPVSRWMGGGSISESDAVDPQGLAAVRESLTSSSSSSTVKDGDKLNKDKKQKKRLPPPPPSPPPRKSSQNFRRDSNDDDNSPQKPSTKSYSRPTTSASQKSSNIPSLSRNAPSPSKQIAPRRPSRDGTPDIQGQLQSPVRIIHSNLSSSSLPGERRGSNSDDVPPMHPKARSGSTSQIGGLASPPKIITGVSNSSGAKKLTPTETTPTLRTPSPNVGSSFRFPFFGRKKHTSEGAEPTTVQSKKETAKRTKVPRKGPVAGTGHEGYGKVGAIRRRSGSSSHSRAPSITQSPQEGLESYDSFFTDRMNPVVIVGGEIVENRNTSSELSRTESNQSLAMSQTSLNSTNNASESAQPRLAPAPILRVPLHESRSRRPSESSDSDGGGMKSTLAYRRSKQRLRSSPDGAMRLPHPINTSGIAPSPMTSFDTSVMSDESYIELQREVSHGSDFSQTGPKKLTKRSRSPRKWNLFGRSNNQAKAKQSETAPAPVEPTKSKQVAYYTIMDSPEKESLDIRDVIRSAEAFSESTTSLNLEPASPVRPSLPRYGEEYRDLPIPAPLFMSEPAMEAAGSGSLGSGRPSRLKQVGRIPKVVSHRYEYEPLLSPRSFSRPFRGSIQMPPQDSSYLDPNFVARGPDEDETGPIADDSHQGLTDEDAASIAALAEAAAKNYSMSGSNDQEFIRFSPRKNSECTVGTSSSSGVCSFSDATAVIPLPDDPPVEDEVWDEYNDLLEEETTKQPSSATSSRGIPFHLEHVARDKPMESPTIVMDSRQPSMLSVGRTDSSCFSADMTERIRAAFQPHDSPSLPPDEFSAPEEEPKDEIVTETTTIPDRPLRRSLSPVPERNSDSSFGSSSDDRSPLSQVNLRVGSMTVSKWLTFGHVLFSDVRHELIPEKGSLQRHGVLVIDGLGNDDWSFYAAETYPQASFFNLSPRAPLPSELRNSSSSFPLSPPNHHQIQYTSQLDKFPFAPQSFTAVVYRFPVAAPESHYRNILNEARRVLKPGGYLELSILDVDLNNMGPHGRRAARQLKERIHQSDSEMNLASTADLIVRHIGKAGFSNIRAARVGVPVASPIGRDSAGIRISRSSLVKKDKKNQPSLSEMMSDDSPTADESITKMVARVGRWWYTRCYETAIDPTGSATIWSDKELLKECEQLGTSFKLMVCCGRAPDRVLSV